MGIKKSDKISNTNPETLIRKTAESKVTMVAKILVVEDNVDAQTTLCELLSMLGYEAAGVLSAEDALAQLAGFDILLTDVNLPGMNGIELAMKSHALNASKPIIISSGMDISTQLPFAVQLLPKPFSIMILSEILDNARKLTTNL